MGQRVNINRDIDIKKFSGIQKILIFLILTILKNKDQQEVKMN